VVNAVYINVIFSLSLTFQKAKLLLLILHCILIVTVLVITHIVPIRLREQIQSLIYLLKQALCRKKKPLCFNKLIYSQIA